MLEGKQVNFTEFVVHFEICLVPFFCSIMGVFTTCRLFKQYLVLTLESQMASALFRLLAAVCRNMIVASTFRSFSDLLVFSLGGYILPRGIFMLN